MAGLRMDLRASTAELRLVRRALSSWLKEQGVDADDVSILTLVANELVANAVGAARGASSRVELNAALAAGVVTIEVSDDGPGFVLRRPVPPPGTEAQRSRGLHIVDRLSDALWTTQQDGRTMVAARRTVSCRKNAPARR